MPKVPSGHHLPGDLDAEAIWRLVGAGSDLTLLLDGTGSILDVECAMSILPADDVAGWRGRAWNDVLTVESRDKAQALLRDAAAPGTGARRWRQLNHPVPGAEDVPVSYTTVRIDAGSAVPARQRIVAFGRDLSTTVVLQRRLVEAQQAMEQDYQRFREAETRYRHLFETSSEAILIVDGLSQKVLEANPSARALCAAPRVRLPGAPLHTLFDAAHAELLQNLLASARSVGRQDAVRGKLAAGGKEVVLSASVFRQQESAFVLVRLTPVPEDTPAARPRGRKAAGAHEPGQLGESLLQAFMQHSPDALVFCDGDGKVLSANRSFLDLAQLATEDQVRGQPLDRWVGRTGVELGVLITNLRQRGSIGLFVTTVRGEYGGHPEVEIAGATLGTPDGPVLAFALRDIERRLKSAAESPAQAMPRSTSELTELVGRTPLKDIVAETTDLIEELCIETALQMTRDNRASAALLLGLSRQSLYVKMRRYGLGSLAPEEDETAQ